MGQIKHALAAGLLGAAALSLALPAAAGTVVTAIETGPFDLANPLGTIPSLSTVAGNTYDFTFSTDATERLLLQLAAATVSDGSVVMSFSLYSGMPDSGMFVASSPTTTGPALITTLGPGDYYLETGPVSTAEQLLSGGLAVVAAPEPGTWAMMLVGVGAMGAMLRARRRRSLGGALA